MKEKMWHLLVDSHLMAWCGAGSIMDNAIKISRECYCELSGWNEEWLKEQIEICQKEAMDAIHNDCKYQKVAIELLEHKLTKLKAFMEEAERNA